MEEQQQDRFESLKLEEYAGLLRQVGMRAEQILPLLISYAETELFERTEEGAVLTSGMKTQAAVNVLKVLLKLRKGPGGSWWVV